MSARYLKKVLKEQEQQKQLHGLEEDTENQLNESESPDADNRPFINPFDLLDDGVEEDDLDRDDDADDSLQLQGRESRAADETSKGNDDSKERSVLKSTSNVASSSNSKSKKKKKKKNKGSSLQSADKVEAPLDAILETLSLDSDTSSKKDGLANGKAAKGKDREKMVKQSAPNILLVDPKYLKAENELRRIFGSKVVKSFENNHQTGSSRQIRGVRRGNYSHRKTILVTPSDHWPRWDGSLSMEFLETRDGQHYFRYVHSSSYAQAQRAYEAVKAIHDLNGVAGVLMHYPYHLDSLITMAEYFTVVGELQMSADSTAKCLYALECAWHPMFTPLQGNCQLKFAHETNKPMFTSLFTHMKNMDRRGCHRSALEVCKLLLSLDADDPMGAMFCIDYFALRAEEYSWLEQFSEEYASDTSIWMFPNFSFSLAVSRFYLERISEKDGHIDASKATAADLMKQALLLHPSVLKKLVVKTPLKDQVWTKILKHSFFRLDDTGILSLDHLINMYVERSYIVWRLPDLQKLLRDAALLVIETLEQDGSEIKDWACVRQEAFSSKRNEYGHLLVSDFSDSVPRPLPPDNLQDFVVDPRMGEIGDQAGNPNVGGPATRDIANRSALAVLFESMLPWVNYEGIGDGGDEDDQPNGHGQELE